MRQTSQHCFQVSVKDCVSTVKVESARDAKKTAESLQRDTRPLAAVTKLILSSWIQLLIPFLTSILWLWGVGYHSSCLSLCVCLCPCSFCHDQTSYLFLSPFPTLMCPLCDPITPLPFPLFPCGGDMWIRAGESSTSACLGMLEHPWSDTNRQLRRSQSDQTQAYLVGSLKKEWLEIINRVKSDCRCVAFKGVYMATLLQCCIQAQEEDFCLTFVNRDDYSLCHSSLLRRMSGKGGRPRGWLC